MGISALGDLVVRTDGQTLLAERVRDIVRHTDPRIGAPLPSGMNEVIGSTLRGERFYTALRGTFAAIALTLAAVGIYGVGPAEPPNLLTEAEPDAYARGARARRRPHGRDRECSGGQQDASARDGLLAEWQAPDRIAASFAACTAATPRRP